MFRSLRLYHLLIAQQLKATLEYRLDFVIQVLSFGLRTLASLAFVWVLFLHIPELAGWSLWEVALVYAMFSISNGLESTLLNGPWQLAGLIRLGELDRLLLRPVDPMVTVFSLQVAVHGLGGILLGLVLLAGAAPRLAIDWNAWSVGYLVASILCGTAIKASISLGICSLAFFTNDPSTTIPLTVNRIGEFARLPVTLYPGAVGALLTWVMPFAFVAFVPASVLLGKSTALALAFGAPVAAILTFLIARTLFQAGLRRYQSAGT